VNAAGRRNKTHKNKAAVLCVVSQFPTLTGLARNGQGRVEDAVAGVDLDGRLVGRYVHPDAGVLGPYGKGWLGASVVVVDPGIVKAVNA
jgi:hypothetical protein